MLTFLLTAGQMTDSGMLTFALRRMRTSVVLLAPFLKLQRKFLKLLLTNFGGADKAPRLQAFLFIRSMAAMLPAPCLQHALKVGPIQQNFVCLKVPTLGLGSDCMHV